MNADMTFENTTLEEIKKVYSPYKDKELVIFGAGRNGIGLLGILEKIGMRDRVVGFCDNNESAQGTEKMSVMVYSPEDAFRRFPDAVFIISNNYSGEIYNNIPRKIKETRNIVVTSQKNTCLEKMLEHYYTHFDENVVGNVGMWFEYYANIVGEEKTSEYLEEVLNLVEDSISKEVIRNRINFFQTGDIKYYKSIPVSPTMYFDPEYIDICDNEVFFDVGAYDGDSLKSYLDYTHSKFNKIYLFEPDNHNYRKLLKYVEETGLDHIETHKVATGKEKGRISFLSVNGESSRLSEEDNTELLVDVTPLDRYYDASPTFIKLDVEGAEMDTLHGAERIISEKKPKLAISIYHKYMDFYEIPVYLKSLVPEYRFKIRHHTYMPYDTVLYAEL